MKACVFVGPTLCPQDLPPAGDIAFLPPAAQGDVYRVTQMRPVAIGIIDGYFEGALAVWHKEILFAMAGGIHVFGSASMGALRAAELHPFGMRGIGRVFEAYRAGALEDDDEVAVIHGPPETGYLALSEAMVNIRATLAAAARDGLIGPATRDALALLDKHIVASMAKRGVTKYRVGEKTVNCSLFLDFIVFDEHTCIAQAPVCWGKDIGKARAKAKPKVQAKAQVKDKK